MYTEWNYYGDVSLEYGGYFVRHDLNEYGFPHYSEVIEIIDLESGAGADGLTAVSFMTTFDFQNKKKVKNIMSSDGVESLRKMGKKNILDYLAVEFCSYGYYDPWEDYYTRPSYFVLVNKGYGQYSDKGSWDGWKINKDHTVILHKQYGGDLEAYMQGEWLS